MILSGAAIPVGPVTTNIQTRRQGGLDPNGDQS